jgi:hypothetical protein
MATINRKCIGKSSLLGYGGQAFPTCGRIQSCTGHGFRSMRSRCGKDQRRLISRPRVQKLKIRLLLRKREFAKDAVNEQSGKNQECPE